MPLLRHGLLGTLRLIRNLADQFRKLSGHFDDLSHQAMHLLDEAVECPSQLPQFVLTGDRQTPGQVALTRCDIVKIDLDLLQRTQERVVLARSQGKNGATRLSAAPFRS